MRKIDGVFLFCFLWHSLVLAADKHWLQFEQQDLTQLYQWVDDIKLRHDGLLDVFATDEQQAVLSKAGFEFSIKQRHLSQFYAQRGKSLRRNPYGGFRNTAQIQAFIQKLAQDYPQFAAAWVIGQSHQGRDIWALRLSDNPRHYEPQEATVWFDGLHHAREPMSAESLLFFAQWVLSHQQNADIQRLLASRNILIIPCVNPDGYEYNLMQNPDGGGLWRKNRRLNADGSYGVDLNRNYAWAWGDGVMGSSGTGDSENYRGTAAFSELETQALQQLLHQQPPKVSVTVHSYGDEWMYSWGYQAQPTADDALFAHYAQLMTAQNQFTTARAWQLYGVTNGATDDYHYGQLGSLAFTVEIGNDDDGFWPAPARILPLAHSVLAGYQTAAQVAGGWLKWGQARLTALNRQQWRLDFSLENKGLENINATVGLRWPALLNQSHDETVHLSPRASQNFSTVLTMAKEFTTEQLLLLLNIDDGHSQTTEKHLLAAPKVATVWQSPALLRAHQPFTLGLRTQAKTAVEVYFALDVTASLAALGFCQVGLSAPFWLLWQGRSDDNGEVSWSITLPSPLPFVGENVYLQAVIHSDPLRLSPVTSVALVY